MNATPDPPPRFSRLRKASTWVAVGLATALVAAAGAAAWRGLERLWGKATDPGPVIVNVEVDPAFWKDRKPDWDPYFYYLPVAADALTPPPEDCRDRRDWAWKQGGSDADESRIAVTLTGGRAGEVSVDSMRLEIVSRRKVDGGVVAACPVGGASAEVRGLNVDLDAEKVSLAAPGDGEVPGRFTLKRGETEVFDLYASLLTSTEIVEWRLEISVVDGDQRVTTTLDDNGAPFRTAGTAGVPMRIWKGGAWHPYDP